MIPAARGQDGRLSVLDDNAPFCFATHGWPASLQFAWGNSIVRFRKLAYLRAIWGVLFNCGVAVLT